MLSEEDIERLAARKAKLDYQKEMTTNPTPAPEGDVSGVKGHLAVYRVDADGNETLMAEGQNTITDKGREYFSRLIGGIFASGDDTDHRPFAIAMGNGNEPSPAAAINLANLIYDNGVGASDLALTSYNVLGQGFDSTQVSIVNSNQLQIEFTLPSVTNATTPWAIQGTPNFSYNGQITEAGLFAEGVSGVSTNGHSPNEMMAYKTFNVNYDSTQGDFSILFRWTISFTNA